MAHKSAPNPNTQIPNPETTPQTQAPTTAQLQAEQKAQTKNMSLEERLKKLMESMSDWERKKLIETEHVIVELVKLPKRETKKRVVPERLVLHIKRSNSFRGIIVDSAEVLEDLVKVLNNQKLQAIARALDTINNTSEAIELEL